MMDERVELRARKPEASGRPSPFEKSRVRLSNESALNESRRASWPERLDGDQSRSSSLIDVFERVLASTFFTITAQ